MNEDFRSKVEGLQVQAYTLDQDDGRRVEVLNLIGQAESLLVEAHEKLHEAERGITTVYEEDAGG